MPKFVEMISEGSDDEIEIIPFVKPPRPVLAVIDLLESSESDEELAISPSKSKKKKRAKNPQNCQQNGNNETEINVLSNQLIQVASSDCDKNVTLINPPSTSSSQQHLNGDRIINDLAPISSISTSLDRPVVNDAVLANGTGTDNSNDGLTLPTINNADTRTFVESEQLGQQGHESSRNAVVPPLAGDIHESEEQVPIIRIASSIFESDNGAVGDAESSSSGNTDNGNASTAIVGQSIDSGSSVDQVSGTPGGGKKSLKRLQSSKDANGTTTNQRKPPKPRVSKKQLATERTNEAISSFLTTIGLYQPSEGQLQLSPPKRIRKSRAKVPPQEELPDDILVPPPPPIYDDFADTATPVADPSSSIAKTSTSATSTTTAVSSSDKNSTTTTTTTPVDPVAVDPTIPTPSTPAPTITDERSINNDVISTPVAPGTPFVSVSTDSATPSRSRSKSPKKRNKRAKLDQQGLIEDVTFTDRELNEITVNIRTNILIGGSLDSSSGINDNNATLTETENNNSNTENNRRRIEDEIESDIVEQQIQIQPQPSSNYQNNESTSDDNKEPEKVYVAVCPNCDALSKDLQKCDGCAEQFRDDVLVVAQEWVDNSSNDHNSPNQSSNDKNNQQNNKSKSTHKKKPSRWDVRPALAKSVVLTNPFGNDNENSPAPLVPVVTIQNDQHRQPGTESANEAVAGPSSSTHHMEPAQQFDTRNWRPPSHLPATWNPSMVQFYDSEYDPDFRLTRVLETMSDDPDKWQTNEFAMPKPKSQKRFRCLNCNQIGHLARHCTEKRKDKVCALCGGTGHLANGRGKPCPNLLCLKCGTRRSRISHGCPSCANLSRCGQCNAYGHRESSCPDSWRRYWSTTSEESGQNEKPDYRLHKDSYCANCAEKGHNYFHCRSSNRNMHYAPNQPRIITELSSQQVEAIRPSILPHPNSTRQQDLQNESKIHQQQQPNHAVKKPSSTVTSAPADNNSSSQINNSTQSSSSPSPSKRTVVFDSKTGKEDSANVSMKIQVSNDTTSETAAAIATLSTPSPSTSNISKPIKASVEAVPTTPTSRRVAHTATVRKGVSPTRRCMDYPDCQNKPAVGKTCHSICVVPSEQKFMLQAQKNKHMEPFVKKYNVEITVLYNQSVIHIAGNNFSAAQDELMSFLQFLKTPGSSDASKNGYSNVPLKSPEIITLDEDTEEEIVPPQIPSAAGSKPLGLSVALLNSEWDLIFPESMRRKTGLIDMLADHFKCDIFISKEDMSVKIDSGTARNMKLAQKNIVYWLECQAANVSYTMQLSLEEDKVKKSPAPSPAKQQKQQNTPNNNRKRKLNHYTPIDVKNAKKKRKKTSAAVAKSVNRAQSQIKYLSLGQDALPVGGSGGGDNNNPDDDRNRNPIIPNSTSNTNSPSQASTSNSTASRRDSGNNRERDRSSGGGRGDWDRNYRDIPPQVPNLPGRYFNPNPAWMQQNQVPTQALYSDFDAPSGPNPFFEPFQPRGYDDQRNNNRQNYRQQQQGNYQGRDRGRGRKERRSNSRGRGNGNNAQNSNSLLRYYNIPK